MGQPCGGGGRGGVADQANEDDDIRSESYGIRSRDHIKSMTVDAEDVTQLVLIEAGCVAKVTAAYATH